MKNLRKFVTLWTQQDAHQQFGVEVTTDKQEYFYARLAMLNKFLDDYEVAHPPIPSEAAYANSISICSHTTQPFEFAIKAGDFDGRTIMTEEEFSVISGVLNRMHLLAELNGPVKDFYMPPDEEDDNEEGEEWKTQ